MEIFSWIFLFFSLGYSVLIALFFAGWKRLPSTTGPSSALATFTVVVAARNEEDNILQCLEFLASQHFPASHHEVILVNDHSTDQTASLIRKFIASRKLDHFRLIDLTDPAQPCGKKHAISVAVEAAQGDYIVTTDADCRAGAEWLASINGWVQAHQPAMLIGPVVLSPAGSLFGKMQVLEFTSLAGTTAGAAGLRHPIMCNGANLVFRRSDFVQVGGYQGNMNFASGDDVFLLHKFHQQKKGRILFLKDPRAMIYTAPVSAIGAFFRQRIRWASKSTGYTDWFTLLVAGLVAMVNLLLAGSLAILVVRGNDAPEWLLLAVLLKALTEFVFLWQVIGFYENRRLMWIFPLVFLVYPFYVFVSALFSLAGPAAKPWK